MNTWIHSGPPAEQEAYAAHAVRHSDKTDQTPDGALFFVSSQLEHGDIIVPIANTVVVSADVRPDLRPHLARVGMWSMESTDQHSVADALQSAQELVRAEPEAPKRLYLPGQSEEDDLFADSHPFIYSLEIGSVVAAALVKQKSVADRHVRKYGASSVDSNLRKRIHHGLGYAQDNRIPEMHEAILALMIHDLWVPFPSAESGTRLVLPIGTKRGRSHNIGIYQTIERGDTHSCAGCGGHFVPGGRRFTEHLPRELAGYSDHDHLDYDCITKKVINQGDLRKARVEPIPPERLQHMGHLARAEAGYRAHYRDWQQKKGSAERSAR